MFQESRECLNFSHFNITFSSTPLSNLKRQIIQKSKISNRPSTKIKFSTRLFFFRESKFLKGSDIFKAFWSGKIRSTTSLQIITVQIGVIRTAVVF